MSEDDARQEYSSHTAVWQRQCRRRLQENPLDLDALFAKAAWLAKVEEYEKCIETLDIITKRDSFYPGVWRLKAKIHSRLGNERMATLCLERGEERSR
ncbi:MAG: hypothetical protein KAW84_06665 [Thermoplasmata archaeon]|nr:hypothetical protein [Thermoplasmata archaeon]